VAKKKKWKEKFYTYKKLHGNVKNTNKFCKGCKYTKECDKGRRAAIAYCEDKEE
jgi:hypothetical protein